MKYKIIIISLIVILILICIIYFLFNKNKVEIKNIKSFSFTYTNGYSAYSYTYYYVSCNEKCLASIKPNDVPEEEKIEVEIQQETIDKLQDILIKYDVAKWNGFNKNDKSVLDGDSFSINIKMDNEKIITAHGYMKWPKNYSSVKKEIDELFEKYISYEK